ncbi:MAG: DUF1622 domain-containing protein, partial [Limisphaerales bacterium]
WRKGVMENEITLYFGSVAEALIVLAVVVISGVALTTGYSVLKNHQRYSGHPKRSPAWDSFAAWLLIAIQIVLAVHIIKAIVWPNWITLCTAGAIGIIQMLLNWLIRRDIDATQWQMKHERI